MKMPDLNDELLVSLYQEAIQEIDVEDLEETGRQLEIVGNALRNLCAGALTIAIEEHGISEKDFGKLLILNGLSAIAVANYRERSN